MLGAYRSWVIKCTKAVSIWVWDVVLVLRFCGSKKHPKYVLLFKQDFLIKYYTYIFLILYQYETSIFKLKLSSKQVVLILDDKALERFTSQT